jgi:hypothetical protein
MKFVIIGFIVVLSMVACQAKIDRGDPTCSSNIYINQGEGTYDVDSVSELYKKAILENYSKQPYSKDCGDSAGSAILYQIIRNAGLFDTDKIMTIQVVPKVEELDVCMPFIYKGHSDSAYFLRDVIRDTSNYCTRKYVYLRLKDEPIQLYWEFAEPKTAGIPRLKLLEILHQSMTGASGSTMIVRVWYKGL